MIPTIAIVGRPNVGKSSLLNLLAGRRISIVDPTAGVTRDRIATNIELPALIKGQPARQVQIVDTGGYGIEDSQNLTEQVERQIASAVAEAHLILFVVDAQTGVQPLDEEVARLLRGAKTPVLMVANKVDGPSHEADAYECGKLGFGEPLLVSAANGYQRDVFLEKLYERLPEPVEGEKPLDPGMLLAIVGKRNAGKSTLVNALVDPERVIVSEVEGTTRDSVDVRFEIDGHVFTAIDTAGVRKGKSIKGDIEFYSHHRSLRSLRRADVVLLVVDATVPISQVDKQLSNELQKHFKPTVIVVNKWDLVEKEHNAEEYSEYLAKALKGLDFAPIVFVSAKAGEGVRDAIAMAMNLYAQAGHRVSTGELNRITRVILAERAPSSPGGKKPKVYYVTQLDVRPPTIGMFVNNPDLFTPNYERFFINRLRDEVPFAEVPIKVLLRQRKQMPQGVELDAAVEDDAE